VVVGVLNLFLCLSSIPLWPSGAECQLCCRDCDDGNLFYSRVFSWFFQCSWLSVIPFDLLFIIAGFVDIFLSQVLYGHKCIAFSVLVLMVGSKFKGSQEFLERFGDQWLVQLG
jgi:hypothetical protein